MAQVAPLLPQFQCEDNGANLMQNSWASIIQPFISNPYNAGRVVFNVDLVSGDNTINHFLGRKLQGWTLVRVNAAMTVFDKQDTNPRPELTLVLNTTAPGRVSIYVF